MIIFGCSSQYTFKEPIKSASQSSPEAKDLINKGIQAHDAKNYDQALQFYQDVLKADSANVEAMYEMAFSYFAKGDYQKSLDVARKGAEYESPFLGGFYLLMGNDLDELGKTQDAIKVYKSALKHFSNDHLLYYNLGVSYKKIQKYSDAKEAFKEAVKIKPTHPSSHIALAEIFQAEGNTIPALLAYSRFLILEQNSQRADYARSNILKILNGNVSKEPNSNNINIYINPDQSKSEGDFSVLNFGLSLIIASHMSEEGKKKSDQDVITDAFSSLFQMMDELNSKEKSSGFTVEYYVPYFVELHKQNFTPAFCDLIFKKKEKSDESIDKFLKWSNSYNWSATAH